MKSEVKFKVRRYFAQPVGKFTFDFIRGKKMCCHMLKGEFSDIPVGDKTLKKAMVAMMSEEETVPLFIRNLFDNLMNKIENVVIDIQSFNRYKVDIDGKGRNGAEVFYFVKLRDVFCEMYGDNNDLDTSEWSTRDLKNFLNPIKSLQFSVFAELLPNMKKMEIRYLPLNEQVIQGVYDTFMVNNNDNNADHPINEIRFMNERDVYRGQSTMDYKQCVAEYQRQFADNGWEMSVRRDSERNEYLLMELLLRGQNNRQQIEEIMNGDDNDSNDDQKENESNRNQDARDLLVNTLKQQIQELKNENQQLKQENEALKARLQLS